MTGRIAEMDVDPSARRQAASLYAEHAIYHLASIAHQLKQLQDKATVADGLLFKLSVIHNFSEELLEELAAP